MDTANGTHGMPKSNYPGRQVLAVWRSLPYLCLATTLVIAVGPALGRLPSVPGLFFDNLSHFRLMGICAALGAIGSGWKSAWARRGGAVFLVIHAAAILSFSMPGAPAVAASQSGHTMRFAYANLGWPHARDAKRFLNWIRKENPDYIALTEYDTEAHAALDSPLSDYPYRLISFRSDRFGAALYSRRPFAASDTVPMNSWLLPDLRARSDSPKIEIWVTHALPPSTLDQRAEREKHLSRLSDYIAKRATPVVLLGDLNTTERSAGFQSLLDAGLRDSRNGLGWAPSLPTFRLNRRGPLSWLALPLAIPIDHVLISPEIRVLRRTAGTPFGSDHLPLMTEIALGP
jgi:endonuclease/exonuclease/phosphatase (EEP) superfamily protein YafD